ncbi:hypothetical protein LWI28_026836 [Acer negundo]|uniref:Uncharacterized protein n=1 Tax=Acer negundo TaxID=4023 RepID=A0AAD5P247_ACENE|nr:hypothetical protein LWI28_026836 [Acer negundo]
MSLFPWKVYDHEKASDYYKSLMLEDVFGRKPKDNNNSLDDMGQYVNEIHDSVSDLEGDIETGVKTVQKDQKDVKTFEKDQTSVESVEKDQTGVSVVRETGLYKVEGVLDKVEGCPVGETKNVVGEGGLENVVSEASVSV